MATCITFIATIEIDEDNFFWLEALRRQHFPAERNLLAAHLTLFHTLTLAQIERLQELGMPRRPLPLEFSGVRLLGGGVAIEVAAPELQELRAMFSVRTAQDAQRWRPHVTPVTAKALFRELTTSFRYGNRAAVVALSWRRMVDGGAAFICEAVDIARTEQADPMRAQSQEADDILV
jgi:2'-5' RNA ligase superfamily protein